MRSQVVSPVGLVATLGVLSIGAACGVSGDPGTREAADTPVVTVRDWNGYPTSEISGRLRLVDGCLLVGDSVAFWADGTSWDATTQSVVFESADPVRVGMSSPAAAATTRGTTSTAWTAWTWTRSSRA